MKKFIIFITILLANVSIINCMNYSELEEQFEEKINLEDSENKEKNDPIVLKSPSIKSKIFEFLDSNKVQPSKDLTEIVFSYSGLSDEETSELNQYLVKGIIDNNLDLVKKAIFLGADINHKYLEYDELPAFALAVNQHRYAIVRFLLESGVDINMKICGEYNVDPLAGFVPAGVLMQKMLSMIRNNEPLTEEMLQQMDYVEHLPPPVFRTLQLVIKRKPCDILCDCCCDYLHKCCSIL